MLVSLLALGFLLADPAQIDCPMASMTGAERADMQALFAEGGRGSGSDPRFVPLRRTGDQCAARFGWNEGARRLATMYAGASLGAATMRELLSAVHVDVDAIERLVRSSAPWRGMPTGSPEQLAAMQRFAEGNVTALMAAAGELGSDTPTMTRVGAFIASIALMESARAEFARQ